MLAGNYRARAAAARTDDRPARLQPSGKTWASRTTPVGIRLSRSPARVLCYTSFFKSRARHAPGANHLQCKLAIRAEVLGQFAGRPVAPLIRDDDPGACGGPAAARPARHLQLLQVEHDRLMTHIERRRDLIFTVSVRIQGPDRAFKISISQIPGAGVKVGGVYPVSHCNYLNGVQPVTSHRNIKISTVTEAK